MVSKVVTRITPFKENRHSIYLRSELVTDSLFPFDSGQKVTVKIVGKTLVVEAA